IGIIGGIAAAVAIIVCAIIFLWPKPELPDTGVVMVSNEFHYNLEMAENPYKIPIKISVLRSRRVGTGFFIDKEGRIATNRHITSPWLEEYQKEEYYADYKLTDLLKQVCDDTLRSVPSYIPSRDMLPLLGLSEIGKVIYNTWVEKTDSRLGTLNSMLDRVHKTPLKISGEIDELSVAFSNQHYTRYDKFEPAVVAAESSNKERDLAIVQLHKCKTPSEIVENGILDINKIYTAKPAVQKEDLTIKGFPDVFSRTWDEHFKSSTNNPTTYKGRVSRINDPYHFGVQAKVTNGSSGSPVYHDGVLYGVVSQAYAGSDVIVESARYLKELYDKEVAPYRE
ncbi:MAG: serine protease, partial [Ruminococcus flavefaciens]|nr:serine protease [Ruminococcus flavefaciens]